MRFQNQIIVFLCDIFFQVCRPQKTIMENLSETEREHCYYRNFIPIYSLFNFCFLYIIAPDKPAPPVVGKVMPNSIELYWNQESTEDRSGGRLRYCIQEEEEDARKGFGNVYK